MRVWLAVQIQNNWLYILVVVFLLLITAAYFYAKGYDTGFRIEKAYHRDDTFWHRTWLHEAGYSPWEVDHIISGKPPYITKPEHGYKVSREDVDKVIF